MRHSVGMMQRTKPSTSWSMLYVTHWCSACQIQTPEQHWYLAHLLGYDYSIQYRAGKTNAAADALSRRLEHHPDQLFLLTIPNFLSLQELKKELSVNPTFVDYHRRIQANPQKHLDCSISQDFILQNGCIWLPKEKKNACHYPSTSSLHLIQCFDSRIIYISTGYKIKACKV